MQMTRLVVTPHGHYKRAYSPYQRGGRARLVAASVARFDDRFSCQTPPSPVQCECDELYLIDLTCAFVQNIKRLARRLQFQEFNTMFVVT